MTWTCGFVLLLLFPQFLSVPQINFTDISDMDIENALLPRDPIEYCDSTETVNLSNMNLSMIPTHVIQSQWIGHVDLSFNRIRRLPESFFRDIPGLRCLNLTSNPFAPTLVLGGSYSNSLRTLILDGSLNDDGFNNRYYNPCEMAVDFPYLRTLSVNNIEDCFPDESFESNLPFLDTLYLMHYNYIGGYSYWKIPSTVRHLHLEGNHFRRANESTGANLLSLYLDGYSYSRGLHIPFRAPKLQILSLRSCYLHTNAIEGGFDYPLNDLRLLDLSRNNLDDLPEVLFQQVSNLEDLLLSNNAFTKIPDVRALSRLRGLVLNYNQIGHIADAKSDSLLMLSLVGNAITTISNSTFQGFPALQQLDLSENRLTSMPTGWPQNLQNLVSLSLRSNLFKSLRDMSLMTATDNLRHLFIKGNPIERVVEDDLQLFPINCTIYFTV